MRWSVIPSLLMILALSSACSDDASNGDGTPTSDTSTGTEDPTDATSDDADGIDPLCVDVQCDDENPCTANACEEGICIFQAQKDLPCEDGNACTKDDRCQDNGSCVGATAVACSDENNCTADTCEPEEGCVFIPSAQGEGCVDGNPCTLGDICTDGVCAGIPKTCPDDDNPCTLNAGCDTVTGDCLTQIVPDGSACNDDNACTSGDLCENGTCTPAGATTCDDANPCTDDICTPKGGCVFMPNVKSCDDDDICTISDLCLAGQCLGVLLDCEDGNECTDAKCVSETGCVYEPILKPCEDGSPCTLGDTCSEGQCTSGNQKTCDDNNVCTLDTCNANTGVCSYLAHASPCEDGDPCTLDDACLDTTCVGGGFKTCDDGNDCTDDLCSEENGECLNTANNTPCEDGNPCTINDKCTLGACQGGTQKSCDDGNACTTEFCDLQTGDCIFSYNEESCDDQDLCTTDDTCTNGVCAGVNNDCDDGNECTEPTCNSAVGCVYIPVVKPCKEDNACFTTGSCIDGNCDGSVAISCDDNNACTIDVCDPISGCAWTPLTETLCEDGDPCTSPDTCDNGTCFPGEPTDCNDGNPCTQESECDSAVGCIQTDLPDNLCDTGFAGTCGTCVYQGSGIVCLPTPNPPCNDDNICTEDIYVCIAEECLHVPSDALQGTPCQDGNACTSNDTCASTVCVGGEPTDCDDGNPCTDDACNPSSGCVQVPNNIPCNDGSVCTQTDVCSNGVCNGANPVPCDDGNFCTDDICDPVAGCFHFDNTSPCDDGDACTLGDQCTGSLCVSGTALNCDDGLFCNGDELCNPVVGCVSGPVPNLDDGIACTLDTCFELSGEVLHLPDDTVCDLGELCTLYTCDVQFGCLESPAGFCCGNDVVETNEGCDDGNLDIEPCAYGDEVCFVCGPDCQLVPGTLSFCGDDFIDASAGEFCDDGHNDVCGTCNTDCSGVGTGSTCGDTEVCPEFEDCDDGFVDACGDCNADCTGPGAGAVCGDGISCAQFEFCDDGYSDSCGTCNEDCSASGTGAICGDSDICPQFEDCDDGYTDDCGTCNETCTAPGTGAICGDLQICPELEVCDDGNNNDADNCTGDCTVKCGAIKGGHIVVPDVALAPEAKITFEGWFRADAYVDSHFFRYAEGCPQEVSIDLESDGKVRVHSITGAGLGWGGPFPLGEWTHVAVTFSSGTASIHINGALKSSAAMLVPTGNQCALGIGGRVDTDDYDFPGAIDQIRVSHAKIYTTNSTPDLLLAPVPESIIVMYFDDDFGDFALDESGQGNHGVIESAYWFAAGAECQDQLCGNGVLDLGEQCDDGNGFDGDSCSSNCLTEVTGTDCDDVLQQDPQAADGIYFIDPDGDGPENTIQAYCDMTMDGGGWTLVAVSSDDGVDTWSWNNRHFWDTDTTTFGTMGGLHLDYKSAATHFAPFSDIAFIHAPSGVWASYHDVGNSVEPLSSFIELVNGPVCSAADEGYPLNAGSLNDVSTLCDTSLYFSPRDHDGLPTCPTTAQDNAYGPAWSADNGSGGCPLDDPGYASSLGPNQGDPDVEYQGGEAPAIGFGETLSLNTGDPSVGENYMQVFVRRGLAAYCGNGTQEEGEACDDGNDFNGDGCSNGCIIEPPPLKAMTLLRIGLSLPILRLHDIRSAHSSPIHSPVEDHTGQSPRHGRDL